MLQGAYHGRPLAGDVMFTEFDRLAMTRALALAERGLETTHPNPRVGCVIAKGDRIIGEGFHERAGEPHAEVMALRSAKEPVAGATAYVTLEPCSHHGRTPPCANALIEARIARVVFAVQDPNPRVSGQGADALLRAGITVEAGLMQNEATELNIGFMKRMKDGLPWVRVKLAMSLDGRTALANGASQWITGEAARADVQRWRARCSAVMTGVGTVLADDPQLNVRLPTFKGRQPLRVVLDARLRSPVGAKVFAGGVGSPAPGAAGAPGGAGSAAGGAGAVSGAVSGGVVVFTAEGGGVSAATGAARSAPVDRSVLADGMAELVSAFETSPTSVAAREGDLAGAVSVKAEARPSAPSAAVAPMAPASAAAVSGSLEQGAADKGSANGVAPPVLAAAGSVAGVAPSADDATWAGAALSGAIPVNREAAASTGGAAPGASASPPAAAAATAAPSPASATLPPVAAAAPTPASRASASAGSGAPVPAVTAVPSPAGKAPASSVTAAPSVAGQSPASAVSGAAAPAAASSAPSGAVAAGTSGAAASGALGAPASGPPSSATASAPPGAAPPPLPVATTTPAPAAVAPSLTGAASPQRTAPLAAAKSDSPATFQVRKAALSAKGVRIEEVPSDDGYLDLFVVLKKLAEMEVNEVLVEAGPTLAGQLLTTFLVDELLLYVAPKLLGPQGPPLVNLPELQSLQDAWGFSLFDAKRFGDDLRLRMRPK